MLDFKAGQKTLLLDYSHIFPHYGKQRKIRKIKDVVYATWASWGI
jgi:hypothetical protein